MSLSVKDIAQLAAMVNHCLLGFGIGGSTVEADSGRLRLLLRLSLHFYKVGFQVSSLSLLGLLSFLFGARTLGEFGAALSAPDYIFVCWLEHILLGLQCLISIAI